MDKDYVSFYFVFTSAFNKIPKIHIECTEEMSLGTSSDYCWTYHRGVRVHNSQLRLQLRLSLFGFHPSTLVLHINLVAKGLVNYFPGHREISIFIIYIRWCGDIYKYIYSRSISKKTMIFKYQEIK